MYVYLATAVVLGAVASMGLALGQTSPQTRTAWWVRAWPPCLHTLGSTSLLAPRCTCLKEWRQQCQQPGPPRRHLSVAALPCCRGVAAVLVRGLYYLSPLSTLASVLRTRRSDSLHRPLCITNALNTALWAAYGLVSPA
jgi:hypothetical protein